MIKIFRLLLGLLLAVPAMTHALGLGDIHLSSALNQPLRADIELVGATAEDSKTALVADSANWYLFAVDLALRSGASTRAALLLAERGRARMLRDAVVPLQPGWNIPACHVATWRRLSAVE